MLIGLKHSVQPLYMILFPTATAFFKVDIFILCFKNSDMLVIFLILTELLSTIWIFSYSWSIFIDSILVFMLLDNYYIFLIYKANLIPQINWHLLFLHLYSRILHHIWRISYSKGESHQRKKYIKSYKNWRFISSIFSVINIFC